MKYDKLVRDKIPDIIRKQGQIPVTHVATDDEYWQKLKEKLKEEIKEFASNETEEELADILEVVYAICEFKSIDKEQLELLRQQKVNERGGFTKRIILEETRE